MDGDEVHVPGQVGMTQPEFRDIRVGHRHRHGGLDLADGGPDVGGSHLAAQQHLVADHHGGHDLGIASRQLDSGIDLLAIAVALRGEPDAQHHLQTRLLGQLRHEMGPMIDPIGANAVGAGRQLAQVRRDPGRLDLDVADEGALVTAKGRVGKAGRLARLPRQGGHGLRPTQPPPQSRDHQQRERVETEGEFHREPVASGTDREATGRRTWGTGLASHRNKGGGFPGLVRAIRAWHPGLAPWGRPARGCPPGAGTGGDPASRGPPRPRDRPPGTRGRS